MKNIYLNSNVHKILIKDINSNMLNHSYLLISNDKLRINAFAEYFCCTVLGTDDFDGLICSKILHNNHPDVVFLPQENKTIITEDVNQIISDSYVLPMEGEKKIYVLKNFDTATVQAQNKLLKTLEEPSKSVVFVITTTNESGVLQTIKSRCKKITEGKLSDDEVFEYLNKNNSSTVTDPNKLVAICDGNLTTLNDYLTNPSYLEMLNLSEEIFNTLSSSANVLELSSKMQKYKNNFEDFLNIMLLTLKNGFESTVKNNNAFKIKYSTEMLSQISKVVLECVKKVKSNCNINSVCDGLLMGILEVKYKCQR